MAFWRLFHLKSVPSQITTDADEEAKLREVERVMLAMPRMTRDIFIARRFHDLSIAEICRQTGLSHKQVMRHLAKAVEHLCRAFPNG